MRIAIEHLPGQRPIVPLDEWSDATHERNMRMALVTARRARALGADPVGAVLVDGECRVVARGMSLVGPCCDPTAHAEMSAIRVAAAKLGRHHLRDLILYSTLEPCSMCLAACAWAGLRAVFFAAAQGMAPVRYFDRDEYRAVESARGLRRHPDRTRLAVRGQLLAEEAASLLEAA